MLLIDAGWNNINSDQQSTGGLSNWNIQNVTSYDTTTGPDSTAGQDSIEIFSGTNMSITNSIVFNGGLHLPNFTGSGNIYYNTVNPVPGGTNTNPQFVGPLPTNNTPNYDTFASAVFMPQCSGCSGVGSTLHTYQDILNDIDQLNAANATPPPTSTSLITPTDTPLLTPALTDTPTPISADTTPPTITITSPQNGATVTAGSKVTISTTASDNIGVTQVQFLVNGVLQSTLTAAPYNYTWSVPAKKRTMTYTLTARASDATGNVASQSIQVSASSQTTTGNKPK